MVNRRGVVASAWLVGLVLTAGRAEETPGLAEAAAFLKAPVSQVRLVNADDPPSMRRYWYSGSTTIRRDVTYHVPSARIVAYRYLDRVPADGRPVDSIILEAAAATGMEALVALGERLSERFRFDSYQLVPDGRRCRLVVLRWREREGEDYTGKAYLVMISGLDGQVVGTRVDLPPAAGVPRPVIDRRQAEAVVLAEQPGRTVVATGFQRSFAYAPNEGPVWWVRYQPAGKDATEDVAVDAVTGALMRPETARYANLHRVALQTRNKADSFTDRMEAARRFVDSLGLVTPKSDFRCQDPRVLPDRSKVYPVVWSEGGRPGCEIVLRDGDLAVLEFRLRPPDGPVPEVLIPVEEAVEIARASVPADTRYDLGTDGLRDPVVDEEPSELGAYTVTFHRVVNGLRVPERVEVGVRVYDGQVCSYHYVAERSTVQPGIRTSLEQARAAADPDGMVLAWLEETAELRKVHGSWIPAWHLIGELRGPDPQRLAGLQEWVVDGRNGGVVDTRSLTVTPDRFRWYRSHGGERLADKPSIMRPKMLCRDTQPVFSPDGKRLLFLSNRPRPGWPAWLTKPQVLYQVNADGSDLHCLVEEQVTSACWSPDGVRIAYTGRSTITVCDPAADTAIRIPPKRPHIYQRASFLADGRLLVRTTHLQGAAMLILDPARPEAAAIEIVPGEAGIHTWGPVMLEAGNRFLVTTMLEASRGGVRDEHRRQGPWTLRRLNADDALSPGEVVAAGLFGPGPAGAWLLGFDETGWKLMDPVSKEVRRQEMTISLQRDGGQQSLSGRQLTGLAFSPSGDRMAWSGQYWSGDPDDPAAEVLWLANADGTNARPLTMPTDEPAAVRPLPVPPEPKHG